MFKSKFTRNVVTACLAATLVVSAMAIPAYAIVEGEGTSASSSVIESQTFNATVKRVTNKALKVEPDASAGISGEVAVLYDNAGNFTIGDVVTITYSSAISESNGTKTITADKIEKATATTEKAEEKTETKADTSKPETTTTSTSTTPDTGDAGVAGMATVAVLAGTFCGAKSLLKKRK